MTHGPMYCALLSRVPCSSRTRGHDCECGSPRAAPICGQGASLNSKAQIRKLLKWFACTPVARKIRARFLVAVFLFSRMRGDAERLYFRDMAAGHNFTLRNCHSISGLVVEYIVAIDVTRVRFPADAFFRLLLISDALELALLPGADRNCLSEVASTVWPSGLRRWTQVPLSPDAWARTSQLSIWRMIRGSARETPAQRTKRRTQRC